MQTKPKTKVALPKEWRVEPTEDGGWLVTVQNSTELLNNFKFKLYFNDGKIVLKHGDDCEVVVDGRSSKELWYYIRMLQVETIDQLLKQLVESAYPDLRHSEFMGSAICEYFYEEGEKGDFDEIVEVLVARLRQEAFLVKSEPKNMVRRVYQIHVGDFVFYAFSEGAIQWDAQGVELFGVWSKDGEFLDKVKVAFAPVIVIEKVYSALNAPYALVRITGYELEFFDGKHFRGEWVDGVPISFVVTKNTDNKNEKEGC